MTLFEVAGLVGVGLLVGAFSAMFGVGGGLLMVPFMVLVLGEGQHLAEGTSLAVIVPTALIGAIAHHRRGFVRLPEAAWMGLGGVAGAGAGALLALALDAEILTRLFGVFVILAGLRLVNQALSAPRSSRPESG